MYLYVSVIYYDMYFNIKLKYLKSVNIFFLINNLNF